MDLNDIRRKIQALTRLGGDAGATDAEAENALRFARALMLKHNVSEADLADAHAKAGTQERVEYGKGSAFGSSAKAVPWEGALGVAIADLVGSVKCYLEAATEARSETGAVLFDENGQPRRASRITFYGPASDVRDAIALFDEWRVTIAAMARLHYGGALRGDGRSYAWGFASALAVKVRKIQEEERAEIAQGSCTALVVATQSMAKHREQASSWLANVAKVKLRAGSGRARVGDSGAYGRGQRDGSRASFTRDAQKRLG